MWRRLGRVGSGIVNRLTDPLYDSVAVGCHGVEVEVNGPPDVVSGQQILAVANDAALKRRMD